MYHGKRKKMKAGGRHKAGMGRKPSGKGTAKGAIRLAMNPVGVAASEIRKDIKDKRKQKMGGGKMKRTMYGHGGEVMPKAKPC